MTKAPADAGHASAAPADRGCASNSPPDRGPLLPGALPTWFADYYSYCYYYYYYYCHHLNYYCYYYYYCHHLNYYYCYYYYYYCYYYYYYYCRLLLLLLAVACFLDRGTSVDRVAVTYVQRLAHKQVQNVVTTETCPCIGNRIACRICSGEEIKTGCHHFNMFIIPLASTFASSFLGCSSGGVKQIITRLSWYVFALPQSRP